jgi:hypothetical protein
MSEPPTSVAKNLNEKEALREVIDALRADNGRLLRLLVTGFISDGRPQPKELTEALARHANLRNWLSSTEYLDEVRQGQNTDLSSSEVTNIKARHKRGRRAKRKKK